MQRVGVVRRLPAGEVCRLLFEDEARLVRALNEVRNKTKFSVKNEKLDLIKDSETSTEAKLPLCDQRTWVERTPHDDSTDKPPPYRKATDFQRAQKSVGINAEEEVRDLPDFTVPKETGANILERVSECRRGRHDEAVTGLYRELAGIATEMEPFVLEPGKLLLTKLAESDRKIERLLQKIEFDTALEGFSIEGLEELWNGIHQEFLTRKKWIRAMDECLRKVEASRADKITNVLKKYTVILENISFFLSPDVHRFMNDEAMMINRALLANQRAVAKLFFNLMKSEMKKELSYRLKWQNRVKDWKVIRKNYEVHSFRELMANEETQNPPTVKAEMENMITEQIVLHEKRLEFLQHLGDLLPPTHTGADIKEWYGSLVTLNKSIDTHSVQCMRKMHTQYDMVRQKCLAEVQLHKNNLLNLNVCSEEEAEGILSCELLPWTEKLQRQFEEELEHMDRDFKELAKQHEQSCEDLYSYVQEAMHLWDVHQLRLSEQEAELQKKLDQRRHKQDNLIQTMEANLAVILHEMKTASSEEKLKKHLGKALSSLDKIRASYESFNQVLKDELAVYPEAVLQELISYSISISRYFNVKEIFKQNLQGKIDFEFQDQAEVLEAECPVEQQTESIVQESEGEEKTDGCQQENEETNRAENEEVSAQETEATEKEDGESIPHEREETERVEQEAMVDSCKAESSKIAVETFSTSSGNSYTVLGVEEAERADIPETYFTKYEKEESLPMYLKNVLIKETVFAELKKRIRLCFFEHLEKWFGESLSNSFAFVAAKEMELYSDFQLRLRLHSQRLESIQTNIYDVRAAELLLHKEHLKSHCAGVVEALKKEGDEFLKFCDQQGNLREDLQSRICDMESIFRSAPMTEKLVSLNKNLHSELQNHLEVIQASLRSYRNYLKGTLGKLKDLNVDFLKTCRLFSEGGNFALEELKFFRKCIQEESERIEASESLIKTDIAKVELSCMKQATELINQSEKKFHCLFMNRVFMEKIRRFLSNLQIKIKSEVENSNIQAATLNSYLEKLHQKTDACAHPTADKEALTAEELYDFTKVVLKELKKRSQYLDCLPVKAVSPPDQEDVTPLATGVTLQGPIAVASRARCLRDENKLMIMGMDPSKFPLLNPSSMGKSALDDLAISFIKNLLEFQPPRKSPSSDSERNDPPAQVTKKLSCKKKMPRRRKETCTTPVLSNKKYQIFGDKPPESDTFKGIIMNILWTSNNSLLCLAEEFYQTQNLQIAMLDDLPETFEHCAEMLNQNLLSYRSQTDVYYNSCLTEFQDQLKLFEKALANVSQLAAESLLKEHEQKLSYATAQIRHLFNQQLKDWEREKAVHKEQLHPSLGHPKNSQQLDALCQKEIKRQKDQVDGIHLNAQKLQDCAAECAQSFVSALAAFTENLLLELDESVIVNEVQVAKTEIPREKISTLIRRKQAGLPLQISDAERLIECGSRVWPGIPVTTLRDNSDCIICRETASVTTAKTTPGHVAAIAARDAVYKKYKCQLEQQFARIKEESAAQLLTVKRWQDWWKQSIQKMEQPSC